MHHTRRAITILSVLGLGASAPACRAKLAEETATPAAAQSTTDRPERPDPATSDPTPERKPAAAQASPPPADAAPPEPGRLGGITAAHNRAREALGIAPLSWSPELASYAQRWADKLQRQNCRLKHRPGSGPDAQKYGENIFSATGDPADAGKVVDSWVAEVANYNAKADSCRGVCGHYTQVVWRKSKRLGCGMSTCGDTEVWVCNYDPPGNFVGERPY